MRWRSATRGELNGAGWNVGSWGASGSRALILSELQVRSSEMTQNCEEEVLGLKPGQGGEVEGEAWAAPSSPAPSQRSWGRSSGAR